MDVHLPNTVILSLCLSYSTVEEPCNSQIVTHLDGPGMWFLLMISDKGTSDLSECDVSVNGVISSPESHRRLGTRAISVGNESGELLSSNFSESFFDRDNDSIYFFLWIELTGLQESKSDLPSNLSRLAMYVDMYFVRSAKVDLSMW